MPQMTREQTRLWKNVISTAWDIQQPRCKEWNENARVAKYARIMDMDGARLGMATPNLIRQYLHAQRSALYLHEPEIDVSAPATDTYQDMQVSAGLVSGAESAQFMEVLLNETYCRTGQGEEDMDCIDDCIMFGRGVKVHGYHSDMVYDPTVDKATFVFGFTMEEKDHAHGYRIGPDGVGLTTPGPDGHTHRVYGGYTDEAGKDNHVHELQNPLPADDENIYLVIGEFEGMKLKGYRDPTFRWNEKIIAETPWGKSIHPWMFLMDPDAKRITDARWAAYAEWKTIQQIREDPSLRTITAEELGDGERGEFESQYPDLCHYTRAGIESAGGSKNSDEPDSEREKQNQKVLVWTVFVKKDPILFRGDHNGKVIILTDTCELPLYYADLPYLDIDGNPYLPFSILEWNRDPVGQYATDDIKGARPLIEDYLTARAAINRQAQVEGKNFTLVDAMLDQDLPDTLRAAPPNSLIKVPNLTKLKQDAGPDGPFLTLRPNPVSQDIYKHKSDLRQEIREELAENELGSGQPLPSKRTATEVHGLLQQRRVGLDRKHQAVNRFVSRSAWIIGSMLQQFYEGRGELIAITDRTGQKRIVPFTNDLIRRHFVYKMRASSTTPQMKDAERQQKLQILMQFTQSVYQLMSLFPSIAQTIRADGLMEMWKATLSQWDMPGVDKVFGPAPPSQIVQIPQPGQSGGGGTSPGPRPSPYSDESVAPAYSAVEHGAPAQLAQSLGRMEQG